MPDLLWDFTSLIRFSEEIPESHEWCRQRAKRGDIPAERVNNRLYVGRDFVLRFVSHRNELDSFEQALQTIRIMQDQKNDRVSTTISELSEEWGFSRRRLKDAATNLSNVAESNGAIETTEEGVLALRRRLSNQTSTG